MELYDFPTGKYVRENNLKIQVIFKSSLSQIFMLCLIRHSIFSVPSYERHPQSYIMKEPVPE